MSVHRAKKALEAMQNGKYFRVRLLLEGSLIGIIVGFIISLFRFLLEKSEQLRPMLYQYLTLENWLYIVGYFLGLTCFALVLYKLVQIEPMASGSGIPQIKGILLGRMHMNWLRVLVYKFVGGVLAIGSGLSLGREGPSVQLGATIGQGISRMRKSSRLEERFLLTSGAGAGLAAAFNAPLAGVIFCLEELQKNFSPMVLIPAIAAALASTLVGQEFFGNGPVFHITELAMIPLGNYGILICLSIFIGFLGRLFNKSLLQSMNIYEKYVTVKWLKKPMIPLLIAGLIGFVLPQILGGGNQLVDLLVGNDYPISLIFDLFWFRRSWRDFFAHVSIGGFGGKLVWAFCNCDGFFGSHVYG
jgi:H+/Cl- antiporter ClcA